MVEKRFFPTIALLVLSAGLLGACSGLGEQQALQTPSLTPLPTQTPFPVNSPTPRPERTEEPSQVEDPVSNINCTEYNPHPMGESIAEKFSTEYQEVMGWYCDGYAFEDILLALQTSQLSDVTPDNILIQLDNHSWEEIWENLELTPE
jgi:hypothetical protein